jgi:two-component system, NarL family, sensor histidine kinase UhpB
MGTAISNQASAASAAMYRSLFEGSPQAVLIVDAASLRLVGANRAAASKYGYSLEELNGLALSKLWPGAEEGVLRALGAQRIGESAQVELLHVRKNGDAMEVSVDFQDVLFADGPAIALHVTHIADHSWSAVVMDSQGRLLEMIARGYRLAPILEELVLSVERLSGGMLGSIMLAGEDGRHARVDAAPSLPQEYSQAIDGLAIGPAAGCCGTAMYLNKPVIVQDIATDPLWSDFRAYALPHGLRACWSTPIRSSCGKVLGAFAMYYRQPGAPGAWDRHLVDIATHLAAVSIEREQAELALQEIEARLRAFIDHALAVVWLKDVDGRYVLVNRRFEQITGIPAESALGRTDGQLFAHALAEKYSANDRKVLQAREAIEFEESISQPDGVHVHLAVKFPLLHPGGAAYGIGAILYDITERNRAERALERSHEELRALAARLERLREEERTRISREIHDQLGQLLAVLHMNQSVLIRAVREGAADARRIVAELESMQQIAGSVLACVHRIATELRPEALDGLGLTAAIEWQAAEFTKRTAIPCHVELPSAALQPDAERATALFRIMQEALTNVARHAGATEVRVELRQDESFLELSVADNGRGFSKIAGPVAASLGLLGMRERAAALRGSTTITSTPGGGTRVTARVPAG